MRRLASAGHAVHVLARFPGKARDLEIPGVVVHQGDVEHRESMRRAMEGVDGMFHLAGWYRIGDRDTSRAERELGFRARPLEEGMRETVLHEMRLLGMVPPAGS